MLKHSLARGGLRKQAARERQHDTDQRAMAARVMSGKGFLRVSESGIRIWDQHRSDPDKLLPNA
jgi:hypothetical protein